MKFIKKALLTIFIISTLGILFRGWIYRHSFAYKTIKQRKVYPVVNKRLAEYLNKGVDEMKNPDIEKIIHFALLKTAQRLNYTMAKNDNDPNKLINSKTAHCVGYAAFFATSCNYLLKEFKLSDKWAAKHQVAHIYLFGNNIHKHFDKAFYKNHDFATIENKTTGKIYTIDPIVYDYLYIDYVTCRK